MKTPFPVVFLGSAHPHAEGRANRVRNIPGATLSGFFDDDAELGESLAKRYSSRRFHSVDEAIEAARRGLVVIESTNKRSVELASQSLKAGVPFLLEKPGAHKLAALQRLYRDQARSALFAQVGYHMRYGPSVSRALALVKDGALGTITTGRFHASVQRPWLTNPWFCDPDDMGGLVFLDTCHVLDLLFLMLGKPDSVTCRIKKRNDVPAHRFEDSAAMILSFGDLLVCGDVCGWETNDWVDTWDIELYGTQGTMVLGIHPPRLKLWLPEKCKHGERGWTILKHESFQGELNYEYELRDVIERIRKKLQPGGASLSDALSVMETCENAYKDARRNGYKH